MKNGLSRFHREFHTIGRYYEPEKPLFSAKLNLSGLKESHFSHSGLYNPLCTRTKTTQNRSKEGFCLCNGFSETCPRHYRRTDGYIRLWTCKIHGVTIISVLAPFSDKCGGVLYYWGKC